MPIKENVNRFVLEVNEMGLFSKEFTDLEDLFVEQISDLYSAEQQLVEALPKMAEAATAPELKKAFNNHLAQTKGHVRRLEQVFQLMECDPASEKCKAMQGLLHEGEDMIKAKGDKSVKDAALIAAAQRVEHYEISGYGTARTFAEKLGESEAAQLLQETLEEEKEADLLLNQIAEKEVNIEASMA